MEEDRMLLNSNTICKYARWLCRVSRVQPSQPALWILRALKITIVLFLTIVLQLIHSHSISRRVRLLILHYVFPRLLLPILCVSSLDTALSRSEVGVDSHAQSCNLTVINVIHLDQIRVLAISQRIPQL
jgi:hypothetical protein